MERYTTADLDAAQAAYVAAYGAWLRDMSESKQAAMLDAARQYDVVRDVVVWGHAMPPSK